MNKVCRKKNNRKRETDRTDTLGRIKGEGKDGRGGGRVWVGLDSY